MTFFSSKLIYLAVLEQLTIHAPILFEIFSEKVMHISSIEKLIWDQPLTKKKIHNDLRSLESQGLVQGRILKVVHGKKEISLTNQGKQHLDLMRKYLGLSNPKPPSLPPQNEDTPSHGSLPSTDDTLIEDLEGKIQQELHLPATLEAKLRPTIKAIVRSIQSRQAKGKPIDIYLDQLVQDFILGVWDTLAKMPPKYRPKISTVVEIIINQIS